MPVLYVIAGPNGIGKTRSFHDLVPLGVPFAGIFLSDNGTTAKGGIGASTNGTVAAIPASATDSLRRDIATRLSASTKPDCKKAA